MPHPAARAPRHTAITVRARDSGGTRRRARNSPVPRRQPHKAVASNCTCAVVPVACDNNTADFTETLIAGAAANNHHHRPYEVR
ncbi:unnamed protein product, partial [Iphiclides podalirius]